MFDLFIHPWYMIAGLILVSAPIIIHLINRMRYRRIRWAAMEFLLKSQKRNRRRLIIEQLILLALRCLLVALAGFLVARFVGQADIFQGENATLHLVVIDDTLSMSDRWREEGEERKAFEVAKQRVVQLAKDAATARSPQRMKVVTLSNLDDALFNERLNDSTLAELDKKLQELTRSSRLHIKPAAAVKWAREQVGEAQEPVRFLHLVSDLRDSDWSGAEADNLNQEIDGLTANNTRVLLLDTAHPYRGETQAVALNHDNMGIIDFRPETRFAAEGMLVQFSLTVRNFSSADRKNVSLNVSSNGLKRDDAPPFIDIPSGVSHHIFRLGFSTPGFHQVSATLEGEDAGVADDNTRVSVVEVRKYVPVLMIDGSEATPATPRDSYFLATVLAVARGYEPVIKAPKDLDDLDLTPFPCIYLLNVGQFSEKAVKKLEDYVDRGGRLALFVGDKVRPSHYNQVLYKNGQGLLPVPLAARPSDKLAPDAEAKVARLLEGQYQVYFRDDQHPIFRDVAQPQMREIFKFLLIDQYWPTEPRFQWQTDPNRFQELVTLPNRQPIESYLEEASKLNRRISDQLAAGGEKAELYKAGLELYQRKVRDALANGQLYALGSALEEMLNDRGDPNNASKRPNLTEFWGLTENAALRRDLDSFRRTVQYGDPLVLASRYGRGQTVLFLTTAGRAWNDWAGGSPASDTYPVVMINLQRYLTGVGDEANLLVGSPLEAELDAARYEARARCFRQPPAPEASGAGPGALQDLGDLLGKVEGPQGSLLTFSFPGTREPGTYYLRLQTKPQPGIEKTQEDERAYVFNVDTEAEGNLKRVSRDSVDRGSASTQEGKAVMLVTPDMNLRQIVAPKRKDMSESPWLYLFILIVLIVEQALAVHLSFHLKGSEAQLPAGARGPLGAPAVAETT
jgi:hypothetical protein